MCAAARKLRLLLAALLTSCSWGVSLACPEPSEIEVVTTGERVEFARAHAPEEQPDEDWNAWLEALEVLRHGSREEKRALFDGVAYGDTPLYGIDLPPGDDETATRDALDELAVLVAAEDDDWLVERIAAALVEEETEGASGLFEKLARHRVPGIRARAVEYARIAEDPELLPALEAMWAVERAPVVRARLLEALSVLGSEVHFGACPELLDHPDYDLASAAIECVSWEIDLDGARRLLERAGRGEADLRIQALDGVDTQVRYLEERIPDDLVDVAENLWREGVEDAVEPALLALLETLRSPLALEIARDRARGAGPLLERALGVIGRASDPGLLPIIEAHARQGTIETRVAAVSALQWLEATPSMNRLLEEALEPSQPKPIRVAALEVLLGPALAEPASEGLFEAVQPRQQFLSWLEMLAVSDPDDEIRVQARIAAAALEQGQETVLILNAGHAIDDRRQRFELVAPEGIESLRCHRVPGEESARDRTARVIARGSFQPLDRYDDDRTTWRLLELEDETPCWLPQSSLRRLGFGEAEQDEPMLSATEIDVALEDVDSPAFARLEAAGIVEAFDRGTTLAAVRRIDDATEEEIREALRAGEEEDDTPLAPAILLLLELAQVDLVGSDGVDVAQGPSLRVVE